ncbi:MAG TPA: ABC transporter permease [Flavobacteriales bacterium]|nr:ABC transporter permease [Flavobacteriales bacterium]
MLRFLFKRITYGILVMAGVVTVVFFMFNVLPGDPARMMGGNRMDSVTIANIQRDLGLDRPLPVQFAMYVNDLSPISLHDTVDRDHFLYLNSNRYQSYTRLLGIGDSKMLIMKAPYLRRSYQTKRRVSEILSESLPETAILATTSMTFAAIVGIILGIFAAIRKDTWFDNSSLVLAVLGMSAPSFFSGIIIAWLFGYELSEYTGLNMTGSLYTLDPFEGEILTLQNLILPAFTLGIRPLAIIVQLTRSSMLDVLSQDYIRTAKSKGLSYYKVIFKHALKNALNPVITTMSGWFASLLAGAVFIEYVFGWKGIGLELFQALEKYDLPVAMGVTLFLAGVFVVVNIVVDIIYAVLDPRVRLS